MPTVQIPISVNLGTQNTGLAATLGYNIKRLSDDVSLASATATMAESPASSGIYHLSGGYAQDVSTPVYVEFSESSNGVYARQDLPAPGAVQTGDSYAILSVAPYKTGTVNDNAATTGQFIAAAGLSAVDDFYVGCIVAFTSGSLQGIARSVSDYVGATRTFIFSGSAGQADAVFPAAPANGTTFVVLGRAE